MNAIRPYLKAVAPALLTLVAVLVQVLVTGEYDRAELVTTITGLASATITFLVSNEPAAQTDLDLEPGKAVREPKGGASG